MGVFSRMSTRALCMASALLLAGAMWNDTSASGYDEAMQGLSMKDLQILRTLKLSSYQMARAERMVHSKLEVVQHVRDLSHNLIETKNKQIKILQGHISQLNNVMKKRNTPRSANFSFAEIDLQSVGSGCDFQSASLIERNADISARTHDLLREGHSILLETGVSATTSTVCVVTAIGMLDCSDASVETTGLSFVNGNVKIIDDASFDGLANLKSLRLTGNSITSISTNAFVSLVSLEVLYLDGCGLTGSMISADLFAPLVKLRKLFIGGNSLGVIPNDLFSSTPELRVLDLTDNGITTIGSSLSPLPLLYTLRLSGNPITDLSSTTLSTQTEVRYLQMSQMGLSSLPDQIFSSMQNVVGLSLSYNDFATIPNGVFDSQIYMKHLYLNGNKNLATMGDQMSVSTAHLEYLYLQGCSLTGI